MRLAEKVLSDSDLWAIVPISAAAAAAKNSALKYYDLQDPPPDRPIYLLTLEPQHPYTKYIVEDLSAVMNELLTNNNTP